MVQPIRLFLLIVPEKIGKIAQVATFEDIPTISRWLYLSLREYSLIQLWYILELLIHYR